ncbi:MAG: hypothetical protein J1E60_06615 [Christensenellaceae bacterium]|nr:hypothetical protein [Christensenellaceae bacterium]
MSKKHVKNYDADEGLNARDMTTTASATEATGMMYNPPHDEAELRSIRDMHALQSTEFAATEFGEIETEYTPEEQSQYDAGVRYAAELSRHEAAQSRHDRKRSRSEDSGRRGSKRHDDPAEFNPELAKIDPDINCVNGHDDRHASMHPLSVTDWANGEGAKY